MIRLKHFTLVATLGALLIAACGDDGDDTNTGAGGSGGATGGSTAKGGSSSGGSSSKGGSAGSAGRGGSAGKGGSGGSDASGGAGDEGGGGGAGPEVVACPADETGLTAAFARAICLKQQECGCEGQPGGEGGGAGAPATLDDCIAGTKTELDEVFTNIETSVTNGRSELSCTNFDTCISAINASSCASWPYSNGANGGLPVNEPACRRLMDPQVSATGACDKSYECIDGWCDPDANTCIAFIATDAACGGTDQLCDVLTDYCNADDVCKPRLGNGEDCTADGDCRSGTCDTEDTGQCLLVAECVWVPPSVAQACSTSTAGRTTPLGLMGTGLLLGLGAMGVRRRQRNRRA